MFIDFFRVWFVGPHPKAIAVRPYSHILSHIATDRLSLLIV